MKKFERWEWYKDATTSRVFIHLLITTNFKPSKYKGHSLSAGQHVIGRKALAESLALSEQQIRTSLNKLKSTNEITIKATNKFSICTIVKWDEYQVKQPTKPQQINQQSTNNQPTSNQQVTTEEEVKNIISKEIKNKKQTGANALDFSGWPSMPSDQTLKDWMAMRKRLKANVTQTVINRLSKKLKAAVDEGFTVDDCISECVERNWKGFDVEWIRGTNQSGGVVNYMEGVLNA